MRVRHLAEGRDQIAGPLEVVGQEQRAGGPDAVGRPGAGSGEVPGWTLFSRLPMSGHGMSLH